MKKKGKLIVISGPSGAGKGTVIHRLLQDETDVMLSVSCTTRSPRPGEEEGKHYYFKSKQEFEEMLQQDAFFEFANVFGQYYGTPIGPVEQKRNEGKHVLLEIDVQGAIKVKKKAPDAVLIFIAPPSMEILRQRLTGRKTEAKAEIEKRLKTAEAEMQMQNAYDYVVINDQLNETVKKVQNIIHDICQA